MDILRFAVLGLGAGAAYVLIAQGVVLIYRGSGVLNFAQGGIAMISAQIFYGLRDNSEWNSALAMVAAIGIAAGIGILMQLVVLHRLRHASSLARLVSTLALLALVQGVGSLLWNRDGLSVGKPVSGILPSHPVDLGGGITIEADRFYLVAIAVVLTVALWTVYTRSRFGLATSAVAENQEAAAVLGWSPQFVGAINWGIGTALAGLAGILLSPLVGLSVTALVLTVIPGLAAALVGRFASFGWTAVGGFGIAAIQSLMARYVETPGWSDAVPFLAIVALITVGGRTLPLRGDTLDIPMHAGRGTLGVVPVVGGATLLGGAALLLDAEWSVALAFTMLSATIGLSLVLITGYAGQISLAQLSIAGVGALSAGWAASHGTPFPLAVVLGGLVAMAVGVVVSLPALRCRGANLAVVTIGLGLCIQSLILSNPTFTGGYAGYTLPTPSLFGVDFSLLTHPQRFNILVCGVFILCAIVVANIRRGRSGRRLLAVRANELAAAVTGIGVLVVKVWVFAVGSAISGVAGALMAFMFTRTDLSGFTAMGSITLLLNMVIGGIGFVISAVLAGAGAPGALLPQVIGLLDHTWTSAFSLATGAGALAVLMTHPHGIAHAAGQQLKALAGRMHWVRKTGMRSKILMTSAGSRSASSSSVRRRKGNLRVSELTVRFGAVAAVKGVNLTVAPGEVLGIIGPNGAGKTTLIDAVTGVVQSTGDVFVGNQRLTGRTIRSRAHVGLSRTFQSVELFDEMTVAENIRTAAESRDLMCYLSDPIWPATVALPDVALEAIDDLGLEEHLDSLPNVLSTGRQRLAGIARALASDPQVLLLDEPTAGLDDVETEELGTLIRDLAHKRGLAVLLIEHDLNLVTSTCDRVVAMVLGEVVAEGSPEAVLADSVVVDAYLGTPDASICTGVASSIDEVLSSEGSRR